jgi:hypothetical protein
MNPFAASKHEEPAPVDHSPMRRSLQALGLLELVGGCVVSVVSVGAIVMTAYRPRPPGAVVPYVFYAGAAMILLFGVLCGAAGYSLLAGRRRLWLQVIPALLAVYMLWSLSVEL